MMTLGTPELVLVLIALGGMTAAATWGAIELKKPRRIFRALEAERQSPRSSTN
jgi:hypothetical protein